MADNKPTKPSGDGAAAGWTALGTLISGILAWGGLGWLLDWWLDIPNHLGLVAGMVLGVAVAVYVILKRLG